MFALQTTEGRTCRDGTRPRLDAAGEPHIALSSRDRMSRERTGRPRDWIGDKGNHKV